MPGEYAPYLGLPRSRARTVGPQGGGCGEMVRARERAASFAVCSSPRLRTNPATCDNFGWGSPLLLVFWVARVTSDVVAVSAGSLRERGLSTKLLCNTYEAVVQRERSCCVTSTKLLCDAYEAVVRVRRRGYGMYELYAQKVVIADCDAYVRRLHVRARQRWARQV